MMSDPALNVTFCVAPARRASARRFRLGPRHDRVDQSGDAGGVGHWSNAGR